MIFKDYFSKASEKKIYFKPKNSNARHLIRMIFNPSIGDHPIGKIDKSRSQKSFIIALN